MSKICILIFVLALALRLGYVFETRTYETKGGAELELAARSLAVNGYLGNLYLIPTGPSAHVSPLYPEFLAGVYSIFGIDTQAAKIAQQICSSLISALGAAMIPVLAKAASMTPLTGALAGLAVALSPLNLWVETSGAWEQPWTAFFISGLLIASLRLSNQAWSSGLLVANLGLMAGLGLLLSPTLLPFFVLLLLAEAWKHWPTNRKAVLRIAVALLLAVLVTIPWVIRNHRALGGWVWLRSNFGIELFLGNNSSATGMSFGTNWEDPNSLHARYHPFLNREAAMAVKNLGELAFMRDKYMQAKVWILEHPDRFVYLTIRRVGLFWFPNSELWGPNSVGNRAKALMLSVISILAISGCGLLFISKHPARWIIAACLFGSTFIYLVTHVDPRYRYPIFPVSMLLSMYCLTSLVSMSRDKYRNR